MPIFGEQHLRRCLPSTPPIKTAATASIAGATSARPDAPVREPIRGRIRRRPILGGLINEYEAAA